MTDWIIIRKSYKETLEAPEKAHTEVVEAGSPYAKALNALMLAKGHCGYVKSHGYHFTDALAEHASRQMVNASGQPHFWSAAQVKRAFEAIGLSLPNGSTYGDATYLANMAYADFYPDPLKDEAACLKYAHKVLTDPDGYEGMVFFRWLADAVGKGMKLNWEKFT